MMQWLKCREDVYRLIPRGGVIAELGVEYGYNAAIIDWICNPVELYLIDAWRHFDGHYEPNPSQKEQDAIYNAATDSAFAREHIIVIRSTTHEAVKDFDDDTFDLVYVDACHLYADVKQDMTDWLPKVKIGGILAGHDYAGQVKQAVDEFCAERGTELDYQTNQGHESTWAMKR